MMKKYLIYLFAISLLSCTKENLEPAKAIVNEANSPDYSSAIQLKVGNYWIYELTSGLDKSESSFGIADSVWIQKDTVVSNRVFFLEKSSEGEVRWLYDSAHCIVATNLHLQCPTIIFSGTNYSDTLMSNPYSYAKMAQFDYNLKTRWGVMKSSRYFVDGKENLSLNADSLHFTH